MDAVGSPKRLYAYQTTRSNIQQSGVSGIVPRELQTSALICTTVVKASIYKYLCLHPELNKPFPDSDLLQSL